ncbi:MAG: flagellar hook-basal body complex protein FliE [Candidatus Adiutrix sp.]|nr:flagellar hook-basal body complex protein FliE [Candidatus Adiutrix sp.]
MTIVPIKSASTPALAMSPTNKNAKRPGFVDHLKASFLTTNVLQHKSATAQEELSTGRNGNIHETLLAISKADVSFRMLTEVRNKVISAYQEVMRMQS